MLYIWVTLLNRDENNFDSATPKELFRQFDMYKKMNGIQDNKSTKDPNVIMGSVEDIF